jgi:hypothetical protein
MFGSYLVPFGMLWVIICTNMPVVRPSYRYVMGQKHAVVTLPYRGGVECMLFVGRIMTVTNLFREICDTSTVS